MTLQELETADKITLTKFNRAFKEGNNNFPPYESKGIIIVRFGTCSRKNHESMG